jgi:transposase
MNQDKQEGYSAEFRASAVKLANESGQPIAQIAKDLGINANTLPTWISKYSQPKTSDKSVRTDEHLYDELKRLKKEVSRLTEERDLLKKENAVSESFFHTLKTELVHHQTYQTRAEARLAILEYIEVF